MRQINWPVVGLIDHDVDLAIVLVNPSVVALVNKLL